MRIILATFLLLPFAGWSQGLSFLDFTTEVVDGKVRVTWTVQAGNQCQDVEVQHSLDGENFQTVFTYAGICGDPNVTIGYDHTHKSPIYNRTNHYRIKVNQDITPSKSIFVSGRDQINLIYHRHSKNTEVKFHDHGGPIKMTVFSLQGHLLFSVELTDASEPIYLPDLSAYHIKVLIIEQSGVVLTKKY